MFIYSRGILKLRKTREEEELCHADGKKCDGQLWAGDVKFGSACRQTPKPPDNVGLNSLCADT